MTQIVLADLDDIVFEGREKRYGAYVLRKAYGVSLFKACLTVSILFGGLGVGQLIWQKYFSHFPKFREITVKLPPETDLPPVPPKEESPPVIPPKKEAPKVSTTKYDIPNPTPEDEVEEDQTIEEVEELASATNISTEDVEGDDIHFFTREIEGGDGYIPDVVSSQEPDISTIIFVEEEPQPVNMADIQQEIGYPEPAVHADIQGMVVLRILVDEKGKYVKLKVINEGHPVLSRAVETQIHKLSFTPAIQSNRPIKFWVNVPFRFKLLN